MKYIYIFFLIKNLVVTRMMFKMFMMFMKKHKQNTDKNFDLLVLFVINNYIFIAI